jgi:hypothetical protein
MLIDESREKSENIFGGDEGDEEQKVKDEKNVRRRVYDALNVLISAGVLRKR